MDKICCTRYSVPAPQKTPPQKFYDIKLPADDFVGEENPLHLWVFDMVASLILHNLEKSTLISILLQYMLPPPLKKATSSSFGC